MLAGVQAALAAFHNATGEEIRVIELDSVPYRRLCDEVRTRNVGQQGQATFYPTTITVLGCEIWRR